MAQPDTIYVALTPEEATRLNFKQVLSVKLFDDHRMKYVQLGTSQDIATGTALGVRSLAAVQQWSKGQLWCVFTAQISDKKMNELYNKRHMYWFEPKKSHRLTVDLNFDEFHKIWWNYIWLPKIGETQLLRHTRVEKLDEVDQIGRSALHHAVEIGFAPLVEELLNANILGRVSVKDNNGDTPLHLAAAKGHVQIVSMLLGHESYAASVGLRSTEGRTPLHYAAMQKSVDVVKALLEKSQIEIDVKDAGGYTAADWAKWFELSAVSAALKGMEVDDA